jgi:hypothetical protein
MKGGAGAGVTLLTQEFNIPMARIRQEPSGSGQGVN